LRQRLSPSVFCIFGSKSPCKSVFCSRFPCKYATFLKKRDFFCKCSFILCKNVNFMCLKKGIFLFYVPIFRANVSLCRPNLYFYHFCSYSPCKYVIFTSNFFLNLSHYVYFIRHNTTFVLRMLFYQRLWNITLFLLHISVQICHLLNGCLVPWYH